MMVGIEPDDTFAYFNLGLGYHQQGKLDQAIEAYKRAIDLDPDDAAAYNNLDEAIREAYENAGES